MVVYSVYIHLDNQVQKDWLEWMQTVHIPEVMQHKGFLKYQIIKLENPDISHYRIDYYIENMELFIEYQQKYAPDLQKKHSERYAGKFTAYRTVGTLL